jgi:hypothetical protein
MFPILVVHEMQAASGTQRGKKDFSSISPKNRELKMAFSHIFAHVVTELCAIVTYFPTGTAVWD